MDDGTPDPDRTPDAVPSLRASDAERDETARRLQDAFSEGRLTLAEFDERTTRAYAARFRDELGELTRDLSPARRDAGPGTGLGTPDRAEPPARRVTGGTGPSTSLAIMGGCERAGAWTLPADHTAVALMGGIEIDLREATLQSHQTTIRAFAVMGGIDILVPDDIHLEVEGLGIMGGFAEESGEWAPDPRPVRQAPPGAPRVRVTGLALMGGVGVRRVPAPAPRA
ncbi:DUF1707 domain-containing protein [uncultured Dietzia sp.]|uniref:DUF1707 SHOCT-like domain-containing protein n=1 Tax=uncultured Dietzia sp. TaxID=395519 RepID=UPI0026105D1F|nr:DUF1707 domain-containing protein [uncultured Dietzia sp.]